MTTRLVLSALLMLGLAVAQARADGTVARDMFTTAVEHREPVDQLNKVPADIPVIYYYTDLRNLAGQTVTHRWSYRGELMAEVPFEVGGPRWRVWSSKKLRPTWTGQWIVTVHDADGNRIASDALIVGADAPDVPADGAHGSADPVRRSAAEGAGR